MNIYTWQAALPEWYLILLAMLAGALLLTGLAGVVGAMERLYAWLTEHTRAGRHVPRGA